MKRRILIICYYFPPLGLAGVTRPLQLFKRLAAHDYDCHVLTVKPVAYYAYEPELLAEPDQSRIHRAGSLDPQRLLYLCGVRTVPSRSALAAKSFGFAMFPDSKHGWVRPAVRLGLKLHREWKYDLLLSTSPPISAHVVGSRLAAETGVKWVADFRDLWSTQSIEDTYRNANMVRRGQRLLGDLKSKASSVTAVNRSIADYIGTSNVITNGFDPDHAKLWSAVSDRDQFIIGLLGTFNDQLPVEPLLNLLAGLREKDTSSFNRVCLLQVGRVDRDWLAAQLAKYGLADRCDMRGLQSRERSIELLNAASLFYLGMQHGREDRITPARVYDLLASGRPMLAYTRPSSELALLLKGATGGRTFSEDSIVEAADYVGKLVTRHAGGGMRYEPIPEYAKRFSWDNVAAQFAALFDRLI